MSSIKLSVIVPCYNSGDSIINYMNKISTYKNTNCVEFIIVDDCSQDDSYDKLKEYSNNCILNITVKKNDINLGPGAARNHAIANSRGEYITFLDSDDRLNPSFFDIFVELYPNNYDLIVFDYFTIDGKKKERGYSFFSKTKKADSINEAVSYIRGCPWGKVYKAKVIKEHNICFLNQKRAEDIPFIKVATSFCNNFIYIDNPLYEYIQNNNSIMHNESLTNPKNAINAYDYIRENLNSEIDTDVLESIYAKQLLYSTSLTNLKLMNKKEWVCYVSSLIKGHSNLFKNQYIKNFPITTRYVIRLIYFRFYYTLKLISYIT